LIINAIGNNKTTSSIKRCFLIEQCQLTIQTTNQYHMIQFKSNEINQFLFPSRNQIFIDYNQTNASLFFSSISNKKIINKTEIFIKNCNENKTILKRHTKEQYRSGRFLI
jgi:hypothetical protein